MSDQTAPDPRAAGVVERAAAAAGTSFDFDACWFDPGNAARSATILIRDTEGSGSRTATFAPGAIPDSLRPEKLPAVLAGADALPADLGDALAGRAVESVLVAPVHGTDGRVHGHLGFCGARPAAFDARHARSAAAVASLLGAQLDEADRADAEREARRRLETVIRLLPAVASTLDIRQVFREVSEISKTVIPHDSMGILIPKPEEDVVAMHVVSDEDPSEFRQFQLSREVGEHDLVDSIADDVSFEGERDSRRAVLEGFYSIDAGGNVSPRSRAVFPEDRTRLIVERGFRSFLRVVLRRGDEIAGALIFSSFQPRSFHASQIEVARRIADLVSLALTHRHLAEEASRAAEMRARAAMLEERVEELVQQAEEREGFHKAVGESAPWKEVLKQAARVAATDTTVLLTGESGTGKEVVARFIHRASPRAKGPLVAVNCAALPEQLLESELFGYERGAFSGAMTPKPGRIEQAARGVLFLDEIGEMSMALQAKLLRVLQEREFQRLGGTRVLRADVRVIAATNRDLHGAMRRNEFREDLFYRLCVFQIALPPLRDRREDILPLTESFLAQFEKTLGHRTEGLSREAREILLEHDWPGNIRELRNALERAVILCDGGLITGEQLNLGGGARAAAPADGAAFSSGVNVQANEKRLIEEALRRARNNKSKAARLLGLSRTQLYARLEKYGLAQPPD